MHQVLVIRLLRRRAKPEVVVQFLGRLLRPAEADAPPRLAGVAVGDQQLAVLAAADGRHLLDPMRVGAALRALLDDAAVFPRRLDQLAALEDIVAAGLLHVDVLARLARPNRLQRVPMVRRGDGNGVQVLVVEHFPKVLEALGRIAAVVLDPPAPRGEQPAVGIDQVGDLDALDVAVRVDVFLSPAVDAGDGDAHPAAGAQHPAGRLGAGDGEGGGKAAGSGPFEEVTAVLAGHGVLPVAQGQRPTRPGRQDARSLFRQQSRTSSGGRSRTYDTRIMIPLL